MPNPRAAVGKLLVDGAGGSLTLFLVMILFATMLYTHHMQGMFIVIDTILQANVATIDGSGQSLDITGVCIAIEIVGFPEPAGALCCTFKCG